MVPQAYKYNDDIGYTTRLLERMTRRMPGNTVQQHYHEETGFFVSYSGGKYRNDERGAVRD